MSPDKRNPGGGAGASDHVSAGGIEGNHTAINARKQQVASIRKNAREELRVSLTDFGEARFVQFRVCVVDSDLLPIELGYSLRVEQLDELIKAVRAAKAEAVRLGWLHE